jgi:hypothetical protein
MFVNGLRHESQCRVCLGSDIESLYRLNDTPLEDQFLKSPDVEQPVFPLELAMCEQCGYVFLPYVVDPEVSYSEYIYNSSVTTGLSNHFDQYAADIVGAFDIEQGALGVDLGSNDGSMLSSMKKAGLQVQGVEPAGAIAKVANDAGLLTIHDYFTEPVVSKIIESRGKAALVTANYMYANIDNLLEFTRCVKKLLADDGIFVVQTGYHPEQMKIGMFDYIYHEHFSYFTLAVLAKLFAESGLEIIAASLHSPKGGSLRVVAQHAGGKRQRDTSVEELLAAEKAMGVDNPGLYKRFYDKLQDEKNRLRDVLAAHKANGASIAGFGASHSTTTLIYQFELMDFLDFIVDDNPDKQGTYSPGVHIPVYSGEYLVAEKPECVMLLAWQHKDSILKKYLPLSEGCEWIIPFSEFSI